MGFIIKVKLSSAPFNTASDALQKAADVLKKLLDEDLTHMLDRIEIIDDLEADA